MEQLPANPEQNLATFEEVRQLNDLARHFVDAYGHDQRLFDRRIRQVALGLPKQQGELNIRTTRPHQGDQGQETLIRIQAIWLERLADIGSVWQVIDIETEGDDPEEVHAHQGIIELNLHSQIQNYQESYAAHAAARANPEESLELFGKIYDNSRVGLQKIPYTPEYHKKTMDLLRSTTGYIEPPRL
jgi:hypothetical protein